MRIPKAIAFAILSITSIILLFVVVEQIRDTDSDKATTNEIASDGSYNYYGRENGVYGESGYSSDSETAAKVTEEKIQTGTQVHIPEDFIIGLIGLQVIPPKEWVAGFGVYFGGTLSHTKNHEQLGVFELGNYNRGEIEKMIGERSEALLPSNYSGIEAHVYYDDGKKPDGTLYNVNELLKRYIAHSDIIAEFDDRIIANESGTYYEVRRFNNFVILMWYAKGEQVSNEDITELLKQLNFKIVSPFDPIKGDASS